MFQSPNPAITTNQAIMIGPNALPTLEVPKRWKANRAVNMTRLIGSTHCLNTGETTSSPSTAPSTVIGGVIMPSPKNNAAPKIPRMPTR